MATTVPTQQTFLRTYSWEATPIAFPVKKVTLVATVEVGRVEKKQEQHAHSCPIYNINQVWEDSSGLVIMQALARVDSITIVLGAHQERFIGLTHSTASEQTDKAGLVEQDGHVMGAGEGMQSGLYSDSPPLLPPADAGREGKVSHNSVDCLPAISRVWCMVQMIPHQSGWADSSGLVIMQALARADSITIVLGAHQERFIGLTHSTASGQGPCNTMSARTCQMCNNGHSTVFSLEYKAEKNEYEVSFQQCHAYTYMHKQFGDVDRKGMCIKAVKVDQHKTRA